MNYFFLYLWRMKDTSPILYSLLLAAFLLAGCSRESKQTYPVYGKFPEEISLTSRSFEIDTIMFRYPYRVRRSGEDIFMFDLHNVDYFYHLFRFEDPDYRYTTSFGKRGEADDEIIVADDIRIGENGEIWTLSDPKKQLWRYGREEDGQFTKQEVVHLSDSLIQLWNFVIYDDSTFILPDYRNNSRFMMIDRQGSLVKRMGTLPTVKNTRLLAENPLLLGNPWFNYIHYNPRNGILASVTQLGEVLEIYDLKNDTIIIKYGPGGEPRFEDQNGFGAPVRESISGFIEVKVTDNYIYAVFNGRTFQEMVRAPQRIEGGNNIYVFDFAGNPVRRYLLDCYIMGFDVDEERGVIYALDLNDDQPIKEFYLN